MGRQSKHAIKTGFENSRRKAHVYIINTHAHTRSAKVKSVIKKGMATVTKKKQFDLP